MDTVGKMMAVEAQRSSDMAEERASGLTHRRGRDYRIENINPAVFGINTGFSLMTNAQIVKAEELCKASTCRHTPTRHSCAHVSGHIIQPHKHLESESVCVHSDPLTSQTK